MARYRRNRRRGRRSRNQRGNIRTGVLMSLGVTVAGMAAGYVMQTRMDKNVHAAVGAGLALIPLGIPWASTIGKGILLTNGYVQDFGAKIQSAIAGV